MQRNYLRLARQLHGLSQAELALRCELDRTVVSRIETSRFYPTTQEREKIARVLGVHPDAIFPSTEADDDAR